MLEVTKIKVFPSKLIAVVYLLAVPLYFNGAHAQVKPDRAMELKADLKFLKDSLFSRYPSLYRYQTAEQAAGLFSSALLSITDETTDLQFLKTIRYLLSEIKDGHLYAGVPPEINTHLKQRAKVFPVKLHFTEKQAFLQTALSADYPAGTELLAIDGTSISEIQEQLFKYVVGDGNIVTKKRIILSSVFYFYYLMRYGEKEKFELKLKSTAGEGPSLLVVSAAFERQIPVSPMQVEEEKLLDFNIDDDHVGVLTVKSFDRTALLEQQLDFPAFIQSVFGQLAKRRIDKLILDLRGNGGGRDLYGSLLYSYLAKGPFPYYKRLVAKNPSLPYAAFSSGVSSFNDLHPDMLEWSDDGFVLKKQAHNNLLLQYPKANAFQGTIVFLIDGLTFSTASEFCAVAKSLHRGTFVGEETGGAFSGNTSGATSDLILPYSKVNVSFGLIRYELAVSGGQPDRGVIPDHRVVAHIADVLSGKDIQLICARALLKK